MTRPFLSALDLTRQPEDRRALIWDIIVPGLLNPLAEMDLQVKVSHDLRTVAEFCRHHPDMPQFPPFMPQFQPGHGPDDTMVLTVELRGRAVAIMGARRKHVYPNLHAMMQSLRLFYADEVRHLIPEGEYCALAGDVGKHIDDRHITLEGSAYVASDMRRHGLHKILARLIRILTLTSPRWPWSWSVALFSRENQARIASSSAGFKLFETGIARMRMGDIDIRERLYWLATSPRAALERVTFAPSIVNLAMKFDEPSAEEIETAKREAGQ